MSDRRNSGSDRAEAAPCSQPGLAHRTQAVTPGAPGTSKLPELPLLPTRPVRAKLAWTRTHTPECEHLR